MIEEKKILIISVLNHLVKRDPAWRQVGMQLKFKVLYSGWANKCIRHHKHAKFYYSRKWREGWLPFDEYMDFFNYAMQ
jgi:hypothetical protein